MDAQLYQQKAIVTAKQLSRRDALIHFALLVTSEAGEAADAIKKHVVYDKPLDDANLREEAGDLLWAVAYLCETKGWSMGDIMEENIQKLRRRYHQGGYSDQQAQARADKHG
jgi:NTP pyrophosphatase (non-canonical NTP hydrolase)